MANGTILQRHKHWHPEPGPLDTCCLIWDGTLTREGYASVTHGNKHNVRVSRLVCEERHGPPFTGAQASHLCDVEACVNPDHIIWETAKQNMARRPKESFQKHSGKGRGIDELPNGKWRARAIKNNKRVNLGVWVTEEEARAAYVAFWK